MPLPEKDLRKQDREQEKRRVRKRGGPPFVRTSREDQLNQIEDMFLVWQFRLVSREVINDRTAVVVEFNPIKTAKPSTYFGKVVLQKQRGRAWIDEAEHRIVRMQSVFVEDVTFYRLGLVAKLHKGTEDVREYRKINDEVWLPSRREKRISARAFMVTFRKHEVEEYSDYRKFSVDTRIQFGNEIKK